MIEKTKLAAPWTVWAHEVMALFEMDDEVEYEYDDDVPALTLRVANSIKADALAQLMPTEKTFGNVTLDVTIVPANDTATAEQVWRWAFDGNPVLSGIATEAMPDGSPVTFALFAPECAQWYADDISNPFGIQTKTYEDVAADVLEAGEVLITSDMMD